MVGKNLRLSFSDLIWPVLHPCCPFTALERRGTWAPPPSAIRPPLTRSVTGFPHTLVHVLLRGAQQQLCLLNVKRNKMPLLHTNASQCAPKATGSSRALPRAVLGRPSSAATPSALQSRSAARGEPGGRRGAAGCQGGRRCAQG